MKPFRIVDSLWRRALARRAYWDKYRLCTEGLPLNAAVLARRLQNRASDKTRREKVRAEKAKWRNERLQLQLVEAPPDVVALCVQCRGPLQVRPGTALLAHVKPGLGCMLRSLRQSSTVFLLRCAECTKPAVSLGRCALHASRARQASG